MHENVSIIKNDKCWMEHTALNQLNRVAELPGVLRAVGLPDLHAGRLPVGIAVETAERIYPHIIGGDIGCGMGLFGTNIALAKYKESRFLTRLNHIRALEDLPTENPHPVPSPIHNLGTIGGGNHFAEFQRVEQVLDQEAFSALAIDRSRLLLLIHSGSRDYGQRILTAHGPAEGLVAHSDEGRAYLHLQKDALLWARRNRQIVAGKLVDYLGYSSVVVPLLDCHHNFLEERDSLYVHRKGAVSALEGPVIIPGSRGSLTYIVMPAADTDISAHSLSHGAGRKWARSVCKSRIQDKYDRDSIRTTRLGGRVVCHDTELLFQEAPEAYKNITHVIDALVTHGLCHVVATLRPLITYKG